MESLFFFVQPEIFNNFLKIKFKPKMSHAFSAAVMAASLVVRAQETTEEITQQPEPTDDGTPFILPWPNCNGRNTSVYIQLQPDGSQQRVCVCAPPFAGEGCQSCADANFVLTAAAECERCVTPADSRRETFQVSGVIDTLQLPVLNRGLCLAGKQVQYVNGRTREVVLPTTDTTAGTATGAVTCNAPTTYNVALVGGPTPMQAGRIRCIPQFQFTEQTFAATQEPEALHFHSLSNDEGPVSQALAIAAAAWARDPATPVRVTRHSSGEVVTLTAGVGNSGLEQLRNQLMQEQSSTQCTLENFAKVSGAGTDVSMVLVGDLPATCSARERLDYGNAVGAAVAGDCRSCLAWVGKNKPMGPSSMMKIKFRDNENKFQENTAQLQNFFAEREVAGRSTCGGLSLPTSRYPAESRRSIDLTSVCEPTECCVKTVDGPWEFYTGPGTECTAVIRESNTLRCPLPLAGGAPGLKELEVRGATTVTTSITLVEPNQLRNYAARVNNGRVQVTLVESDNGRHCCQWVGVSANLTVMTPSSGAAMPSFCWEASPPTSETNGWSGTYGIGDLPQVSSVFPQQPVTLSLQCAAEEVGAVTTTVPRLGEDLIHDLVPPSALVGVVQDKDAWLTTWVGEQLPEEQLKQTAQQFRCPSMPSAPFPSGFLGFRVGDPVMSIRQMRPVDDYRRSKYAHMCYKMDPSATAQNMGFGVRCCYDANWNYIAEWPSRLFLAQTELSAAAELNAEELACGRDLVPDTEAATLVQEDATCLLRTSSYPSAGGSAEQCQAAARADGCVTVTHGGTTNECHCCVNGVSYVTINQWKVYRSGYTGVRGAPPAECSRFASKRPASAAVLSPFQAGLAWRTLPFTAWGHGDPHCETVDGAKFPCNFEGEARWAYCGEWRVHVVAEEELITSGTEIREGTLITSVAISYGGDLVEVSSQSVFLNGEAIGESRTTASGLMVLWESDSRLFVETRTGNRAEVHRIAGVGIAIGMKLSASCDGQSQGLMGNSNAVAEDDLSGFDSTFTLASTATEEEIYDVVVSSHLVTDPADSLFEQLPFFAGNASYRPEFMNEERMSRCPAACDVEQDQARRIACCFDASVGGTVFTEGFMQSRRLIDDSNQGALSAARSNLPPAISGAALTSVTGGQQSTLTFVAADTDGLSNFTCSVCTQEGVTCTTTGSAGATEMTITIQATFTANTQFTCTAFDTAGAPATVQPSVVVDGSVTRTVTRTGVSPWSIVIPSVIGGVLLSFLLCLCCFCLAAAKRRRRETDEGAASEPYGQDVDETLVKNPLVQGPAVGAFSPRAEF